MFCVVKICLFVVLLTWIWIYRSKCVISFCNKWCWTCSCHCIRICVHVHVRFFLFFFFSLFCFCFKYNLCLVIIRISNQFRIFIFYMYWFNKFALWLIETRYDCPISTKWIELFLLWINNSSKWLQHLYDVQIRKKNKQFAGCISVSVCSFQIDGNRHGTETTTVKVIKVFDLYFCAINYLDYVGVFFSSCQCVDLVDISFGGYLICFCCLLFWLAKTKMATNIDRFSMKTFFFLCRWKNACILPTV